MPAITLSYLYTFFALIAVSSILLTTFMGYASAIRLSSETRKLAELMDCVAAESIRLLTLASALNASAETLIQAQASIGGRQYWIAFKNDSARVWLEGGFGNNPAENGEVRVYLPCTAEAHGFYVGGYGAICLKCSVEASTPRIAISSLSQREV